MATATVVAPEPEAPCQHLNRTDAGKPDSGRQVCDDCKQIFQDSVPVAKIGQQLSDLAPEAEVPTATKAAASRAKKARKPKVGKAVGALTIPLNAEELARSKHEDEETARKEYINTLNKDLVYVHNVVSSFANLSRVAEDANKARDAYFTTELKNPEFYKRVQRLADFAGTKTHGDFLTFNGKIYKNMKAIWKIAFGVSYEYIRQLQIKGKLGKFGSLLALTDGKPSTGTPNLPEIHDADDARFAEAPSQPAVQEAKPTIQPPATPTTQQSTTPEKNLHSVPEMVQVIFGFVVSHYKFLSIDEKDNFLQSLIARLKDEVGQENEFVQPQAQEVAEAVTA